MGLKKRRCKNPLCKKEFEAKTSRAEYCSKNCKNQYHRLTETQRNEAETEPG